MRDVRARRALERRLVETFRTKAAHLEVPESPFDRHSPAIADLVTAHGRGRPRARRALIIAAVVVVGAIGLVSVVVNRSTPHITTRGNGATSGKGSSASGIDAPVLAPASVPEGLRLWWISSGTSSSPSVASQLFGTLTPDSAPDPGLLIEMAPAAPDNSLGGTGTVLVRGVDAVVRPSKDAGAAPTEIAWLEANVELRVTIRGINVDQAVATLDDLRPRTGNLLDGFDPTSAPPGRELLGEQVGNDAKPSGVHAQFDYANDEPTDGATAGLTVRTDTGNAYPGYLRTWIAGRRADDGAAVEFDPGFGAVVAWPDGRQAQALVGAATSDAGTLEHVARSVKLLDVEHVNALYDDIQARLAKLPLLSAADLPSGRLELRGNGDPSTVCLRLAKSQLTCANPWTTPLTSPPTPSGFTGGVIANGRWFVFAAAKAAVSIERPRDLATAPSDVDLHPERATAGEWQLGLVGVPNDLDTVQVYVATGANTASGVTVRRPRR